MDPFLEIYTQSSPKENLNRLLVLKPIGNKNTHTSKPDVVTGELHQTFKEHYPPTLPKKKLKRKERHKFTSRGHHHPDSQARQTTKP